jgi:hypothetical protein
MNLHLFCSFCEIAGAFVTDKFRYFSGLCTSSLRKAANFPENLRPHATRRSIFPGIPAQSGAMPNG